jgi:hypothetical protein
MDKLTSDLNFYTQESNLQTWENLEQCWSSISISTRSKFLGKPVIGSQPNTKLCYLINQMSAKRQGRCVEDKQRDTKQGTETKQHTTRERKKGMQLE